MLDQLLANQNNCADRELQTPEWHTSNDFYSHAAILKKYAGLPAAMSIKASIEHAPFCEGFAWPVDYNAQFPALLTMGTYRFETLRQHTDKVLFSMGPIAQYAPMAFSEEDILATKKTLGKTLLVFMPKSSHRTEVEIEVSRVMQKVEHVKGNFDTLLFCMGWKDVLLGKANMLTPYGIPVSAGHMYDPTFLSHLKAIFELADMSMSFMRGTHITYSLLFDTPHYLQYDKWKRYASETVRKQDLLPPSHTTERLTKEHMALFGEFSFYITPTQRKYLKRVAGLGEHRSPEEVKTILLLIEDAYRIWQESRGASGVNIARYMIQQLVEQENYDIALLLAGTLKDSDWNVPAVVLEIGQLAVQAENMPLARQATKQLVKIAPSLRPQAMEILQNIAQNHT